MRKQTPYLAVHVLYAFEKGLVELTEEAFDEAFDSITAFLEACNNEKHRLVRWTPTGKR